MSKYCQLVTIEGKVVFDFDPTAVLLGVVLDVNLGLFVDIRGLVRLLHLQSRFLSVFLSKARYTGVNVANSLILPILLHGLCIFCSLFYTFQTVPQLVQLSLFQAEYYPNR